MPSNKQPIVAGINPDEIITEINSLIEATWTGTKPTRITQTLKALTATVTAQTGAEDGVLSIPAKVVQTKENPVGKAISIYQQASEDWKVGTLPTDVRGRRLVKTTEVARIRKDLDKYDRMLNAARRFWSWKAQKEGEVCRRTTCRDRHITICPALNRGGAQPKTNII
jgi:hypothetical protein